VRDQRHDDTARRRDAAHRERAVDQRLRGTAVQRHPHQLHRAPPLQADEHRAVDENRRRCLVAAVLLLRVQERLQRRRPERRSSRPRR
jgi:hypothetical protein